MKKKYWTYFKKSRTIKWNVYIGSLAILFLMFGEIFNLTGWENIISANVLTALILFISVINIFLRTLTSTPLSDKIGESSDKTNSRIN